jgi:hypothetical protein
MSLKIKTNNYKYKSSTKEVLSVLSQTEGSEKVLLGMTEQNETVKKPWGERIKDYRDNFLSKLRKPKPGWTVEESFTMDDLTNFKTLGERFNDAGSKAKEFGSNIVSKLKGPEGDGIEDAELLDRMDRGEKIPGEGLGGILKELKKKFGKSEAGEQEIGEVKSMIEKEKLLEKLKDLTPEDKAKVAMLALTAIGLTVASAAFLIPTIAGATIGTAAIGASGTFGTYGFLGLGTWHTTALGAAVVKGGFAAAGAGSFAGLVASGREALKTIKNGGRENDEGKDFSAKNIAGILPPAPDRVETVNVNILEPGKAENVSNNSKVNKKLLNASLEVPPVPNVSSQEIATHEKPKNPQIPKTEKVGHQALVINRETFDFNYKPKTEGGKRIFDKVNEIKDRVNNDIDILKGKTLEEIESSSELNAVYNIVITGKKALQNLRSQLAAAESGENSQKSEAAENSQPRAEHSDNLEGDISQKFRKIAEMSNEDFKKQQLPKLTITQTTADRLRDGKSENSEANEVKGREAKNATVLVLQEGNKNIAVPNFDSLSGLTFSSIYAYYKLPEGANINNKFELVEPCEVQKQSDGKWKVTKQGKLGIKL